VNVFRLVLTQLTHEGFSKATVAGQVSVRQVKVALLKYVLVCYVVSEMDDNDPCKRRQRDVWSSMLQ
jgi:hypothetical protein